MKASLRALLEGSIDYAGVFPPASLTLEQAAGNYAEYRQSPDRWLLGRFCCPATGLEELSALEVPGIDRLRVTMLAGKTTTSDSFLHELELDLAHARGLRLQLEGLEARVPDDVQHDPGTAPMTRLLHATVAGALAADLPVASVFIEVSLSDAELGSDGCREVLKHTIAALADYNAGAASGQCAAGLKLRTGGNQASAFPSAARLADALCACRDAGLFWKATAGLHHPLPQTCTDLDVRMHGFVNLHVAAVLATVHQLDAQHVEELLSDDKPENFEFAEDGLRWRDLKASTDQISAARAKSLVSFGSCDFLGPCRELRDLGWLK
ncbi:MAG TPA: hypothetical protein VIK18_10045 [Pirellulales bacterium]